MNIFLPPEMVQTRPRPDAVQAAPKTDGKKTGVITGTKALGTPGEFCGESWKLPENAGQTAKQASQFAHGH